MGQIIALCGLPGLGDRRQDAIVCSTLHPAKLKERQMKSSLRLCAGVLCMLAPALAVEWKALKPQCYVSELAGVVGISGAGAELESYAARVKQATGRGACFPVTIQRLWKASPSKTLPTIFFHAW